MQLIQGSPDSKEFSGFSRDTGVRFSRKPWNDLIISNAIEHIKLLLQLTRTYLAQTVRDSLDSRRPDPHVLDPQFLWAENTRSNSPAGGLTGLVVLGEREIRRGTQRGTRTGERIPLLSRGRWRVEGYFQRRG